MFLYFFTSIYIHNFYFNYLASHIAQVLRIFFPLCVSILGLLFLLLRAHFILSSVSCLVVWWAPRIEKKNKMKMKKEHWSKILAKYKKKAKIAWWEKKNGTLLQTCDARFVSYRICVSAIWVSRHLFPLCQQFLTLKTRENIYSTFFPPLFI